MSSSIVIHVLRPYANEDEYLAHERAYIDAKSMLLIDQPALPLETAIVFDVQLGNGQKPIRAEAKVVGYVVASATGPAGVRVRFKRFGAATKAFIDRAVATSVVAFGEPGEPSGASAALARRSESGASVAPAFVPPAEPAESDARDVNETSGVHRKAVPPVRVPANRDALLARLRARRVG